MLGFAKIQVLEMLEQTFNNGFTDRWYRLINVDSVSKQNVVVPGEMRIEIELAGILRDHAVPKLAEDAKDSQREIVEKLVQLQQMVRLQRRMVNYRISMKSLYDIVLRAVIRTDICIDSHQKLNQMDPKEMPIQLSKEGEAFLQQFNSLWVVSDAYKKLKTFSIVFERYKDRRVHSAVLLEAYKGLFDGIYKRNTVWLQQHEVSVLLHNR
jgi:hypothetical protein